MLKPILFWLPLLLLLPCKSQSIYFPPTTGTDWDTTSLESLNWCRDKTGNLYDYLQNRNSKAFIVLKDGKIVIEKYFGKFTKDSLWYWASAGKTLTAFAVGMAQDDGFLKITDTSSKYLGKGWTNSTLTQEDKITIRHQLSMSSGLDDGVPDNHCTIDTCLKYKMDAGSRWAYHNAPYTLLDKVIETATGKNINLYLNSKLKNSTGMSGLFVRLDYDNVYFSTPRTMARFGLLMLNKGTWNTTKVLNDKNYIQQMTNSSQTLNNSYGYLCWLNGKSNFMVPGLQFVFTGSLNPNSPSDMYSAMGKNGQFMNVIPSQNLVVIRMGNAPNGNEVPFLMNDTMFIKLYAVMCGTMGIKKAYKNILIPTIIPNPGKNLIKIFCENEASILKINGINTIGQVFELPETQIEKAYKYFETSALKSGLYHLEIYFDNNTIVRVKWRKE